MNKLKVMANQEPAHLKGLLPPSFGAWYQLLHRIEKSIKEDRLKPGPDGVVIWFETHPAGMRQGYEFTINEIKARAFDELLEGVKNILETNMHYIPPDANGVPFDYERLELYRFLKYNYLSQ